MAIPRKVLIPAVVVGGLIILATIGLRSRLPAGSGRPERAGVEAPESAPPAVSDPAADVVAPAAPIPPRITGVVLTLSGEPVPGATVEDFGLRVAIDYDGPKPKGQTVFSDGDGRFAFATAEMGGHMLFARHPDTGIGVLPIVRVPAKGSVDVVLRLEPAVEISGRVASRDGRPLPGARIRTDGGGPIRRLYQVVAGWWFRPESSLEVIADSDGRFRLSPLLPGVHDLTALADGHARRELKAVSAPSEVVITLDPGGAIRGVVAITGAEPPAEIRIEVVPGGRDMTIPFRGVETTFDISGLPPGDYDVSAAAVGFTKSHANVTIGIGKDAEEVRLELSPGTPVTGLVLDSGSGKPVAGVGVGFWSGTVNVLGGSYRLENEQATDRSGRYSVHLRPGLWSCALRKEGYIGVACTDEDTLFTVASEPLERDFTIDPGPAAIVGSVRYPDGAPVAGADIDVTGVASNPDREDSGSVGIGEDMAAVTGEDGRFRLAEGIVPWCVYDLVATGPGAARAEVMEVAFAPGVTQVEVLFEIPRIEEVGAKVTGRVVTDDGTPIAGALLVFARRIAVTDADGVFERDGVPPGKYVAVVGALGFASGYTEAFTVSPREAVDLPDIVLRRVGIRVRGTVVDASGNPVEAAAITVWFHPPGGRSVVLTTYSRKDGRYEIDGPDLPEREITVQCSGSGLVHASRRIEAERETVVDISMMREGTVTGSITFTGPPPDEVSAFTNGHDRFTSLAVEWVRETSEFTILRAHPGAHRIQLRAEGYSPSPYREIVVPDGGSVSLGAVRMTRGAVLHGRVLDADGRPVAGVQVAIRDGFLFTDTDDDGRFRLLHVPPGAHTLRINGLEGEQESPTFPAEAVEGKETELELVIPR